MSLFEAGRYIARIDQIDLEELRSEGIRFLIVDRDNTCMPRSTMEVLPEAAAWFDRAHELGLTTCLVSNNFHGQDVERTARELSSSAIHHAMKPAPFAVRHALAREGFAPEESILVGDQVFTDIVAGNLAGVRTILVKPLSHKDLWYTQILRIFERLALSGHTFEGD